MNPLVTLFTLLLSTLLINDVTPRSLADVDPSSEVNDDIAELNDDDLALNTGNENLCYTCSGNLNQIPIECGHSFCSDCVYEIIAVEECPICLVEIYDNGLLDLVDVRRLMLLDDDDEYDYSDEDDDCDCDCDCECDCDEDEDEDEDEVEDAKTVVVADADKVEVADKVDDLVENAEQSLNKTDDHVHSHEE